MIGAVQPEESHTMSIDKLDLSIRNPKLDQEFHITVISSATVRDLKSALQNQYPGNPSPESLTVSYLSTHTLLLLLCVLNTH